MVKHVSDETPLIPTKDREQISRNLSYPLGAEAISEALRDSPQFPQLSISFYARPQSGPVDPECIILAGIGCRGRDDWSIWVSAVPSDLAAQARRFALQHGLQYLRSWLQRRRDDTWFLHWHRCAMAIDPITNEGVLAEFEDNRLLEKLPPISLIG
ncbi:MAG: hypothetical protein HOW73_40185 [Polyangiaceae bacterium]|nr:hypothetical protein [Polyangiaceae bacterium]